MEKTTQQLLEELDVPVEYAELEEDGLDTEMMDAVDELFITEIG